MQKIREILIHFLTIALYFSYVILCIVFPVYAVVKDVENDEIIWAVVDLLLFIPIGAIRGLMYFFTSFIHGIYM